MPDAIHPAGYSDDYRKMLMAMGTAPRLRNMKMCAFWPLRGVDYARGKGMLLVGRAVNGWDPSVMLHDVARRDEADRVVNAASSSDRAMSWVTDLAGAAAASGRVEQYNTNQSPFWRTAHRVATECGVIKTPSTWSNSLAWSNLYKLAPAKGANPTWAQRHAQLEMCVALLRKEIEELDPAIIMVVSGGDWWEPFNQALDQPTQPHDGEFVEAVGSNGRRWVVTCRPEEHPEDGFVNEVCGALSQ